MKVVIQRVKKAAITSEHLSSRHDCADISVGDDQVAAIGKGVVVLVGCEKGGSDTNHELDANIADAQVMG